MFIVLVLHVTTFTNLHKQITETNEKQFGRIIKQSIGQNEKWVILIVFKEKSKSGAH